MEKEKPFKESPVSNKDNPQQDACNQMTKRSFFKSLMGIVATVALAPELAFGRLKMPAVESQTYTMWEPLPWKKAMMEVYRDGRPMTVCMSRQHGKKWVEDEIKRIWNAANP